MPSIQEQIRVRNRVTVLGESGQDVVWVHGFGSSQEVWERQISLFQSSCRCILLDTVGTHASDCALFQHRRYWTLTGFASDLIEVCGTFARPGAIVVAHSFGAAVALLASIEKPDLFSKIVTIAATPRYLNEADYRGGLDQGDVNEICSEIEHSYAEWVSNFGTALMENRNRPELRTAFVAKLCRLRPDIAYSTLRLILEADIRSRLPEVCVPCVLIQPARDSMVPLAVGRYMKNRLPAAKLIEIDTEGHLPHVSAPQIINEILREEFSLSGMFAESMANNRSQTQSASTA